MASAPADFDALLGRIRRHFSLAPTDCLRLQRTATLLISRGTPLDSSRAAAWLAPVVCRSAAEQQHFYACLGTPEPDPLPEGEDDRGGPVPPPPGGNGIFVKIRAWRRHRRRIAIAGALALLALLAWVIVTPRETPDVNNASGFDQGNEIMPTEPPPPPPAAADELRIDPVEKLIRFGIAVGALAFAYLAWRMALRWRRRQLRRKPPPDTSAAETSAFSLALPALFGSPAFRHALGALRRHQAVESRKLHVPRTIRATIRTGGRPVLRYGMRPRTPEYLMLADRESPRDHLPVVAEILSQRMGEEKISVTSYEYFADPRRLQRISPDPDPTVRRLADLAPSHPGARLLMLAEDHDCMTGRGEPAPWLDHFTAFDRPVLLDPGRPAIRPGEIRLEGEASLLTVPATPDGVLAYARRLTGQSEGRDDHRPAEHRYDLPDFLARRRHLYLDDTQPGEVDVDTLLPALELWLGEAGMRLLRMTALYPLVETGLTLLLGSRTAPALLDEAVLVRLARLPWFRAGYLPAWLRIPLVRGLSEDDLEYAADIIEAYLLARDGNLEEALDRAGDVKVRRRLLAWLTANAGSEYHDPILIDALYGRRPAALGASSRGGKRGAGGADRADALTWLHRVWWIILTGPLLLYGLIALSTVLVPPAYELQRREEPPPAENQADPVDENELVTEPNYNVTVVAPDNPPPNPAPEDRSPARLRDEAAALEMVRLESELLSLRALRDRLLRELRMAQAQQGSDRLPAQQGGAAPATPQQSRDRQVRIEELRAALRAQLLEVERLRSALASRSNPLEQDVQRQPPPSRRPRISPPAQPGSPAGTGGGGSVSVPSTRPSRGGDIAQQPAPAQSGSPAGAGAGGGVSPPVTRPGPGGETARQAAPQSVPAAPDPRQGRDDKGEPCCPQTQAAPASPQPHSATPILANGRILQQIPIASAGTESRLTNSQLQLVGETVQRYRGAAGIEIDIEVEWRLTGNASVDRAAAAKARRVRDQLRRIYGPFRPESRVAPFTALSGIGHAAFDRKYGAGANVGFVMDVWAFPPAAN